MVQLTATSNPPEHDAVIVVINEGGGQPVPPGKAVGGAIADPFGAWQTTVFAHQGDSLVVTYQVAGENSLPAMLTVRLH
jgi:hypothetical protein